MLLLPKVLAPAQHPPLLPLFGWETWAGPQLSPSCHPHPGVPRPALPVVSQPLTPSPVNTVLAWPRASSSILRNCADPQSPGPRPHTQCTARSSGEHTRLSLKHLPWLLTVLRTKMYVDYRPLGPPSPSPCPRHTRSPQTLLCAALCVGLSLLLEHLSQAFRTWHQLSPQLCLQSVITAGRYCKPAMPQALCYGHSRMTSFSAPTTLGDHYYPYFTEVKGGSET